MLSYIRKVVAGVFPQSEMSNNPFTQLFDSTLTMDTRSFLNRYRDLMVLSDLSPEAVRSRFLVKALTLNKRWTTAQHEYLSIEVFDAHSHANAGY